MPKTPGNTDVVNKNEDDEEDETLRFPPPFLVPNDPNGRNYAFENDGPEDDDYDDVPSAPEDSLSEIGEKREDVHDVDIPGKEDFPGDDSSGFREELGDRSNYDAKAESMDSGIIEQELEITDAQLAESAPINANDFFVPPLYSATKKDRKFSIKDDDFFADMLGESRGDTEQSKELYQNYGLENEGCSNENDKYDDSKSSDHSRSEKESNEKERAYNDKFEATDSHETNQMDLMFKKEFHQDTITLQNAEERNHNENEIISSYKMENSQFYDQQADFSSQHVIPSMELNYPVRDNTIVLPRILPTPGITYTEQQQTSSEFDHINSAASDERFIVKEMQRRSRMIDRRPSASADLRKVSIRHPVELTLPRITFEAIQKQQSGESAETSVRRKSIPVLVDGPYGEQIQEISLTNDRVINASENGSYEGARTSMLFGSVESIPTEVELTRESLATRRSQSDSNLIELDQRIDRHEQKVRKQYFNLVFQVLWFVQ